MDPQLQDDILQHTFHCKYKSEQNKGWKFHQKLLKYKVESWYILGLRKVIEAFLYPPTSHISLVNFACFISGSIGYSVCF